MRKFILFVILVILMICITGCSSSITLSKEDASWIKEYIDYSNNYIETSFKENPSDAERRAIEPYRARFRTVDKIVKDWNY